VLSRCATLLARRPGLLRCSIRWVRMTRYVRRMSERILAKYRKDQTRLFKQVSSRTIRSTQTTKASLARRRNNTNEYGFCLYSRTSPANPDSVLFEHLIGIRDNQPRASD